MIFRIFRGILRFLAFISRRAVSLQRTLRGCHWPVVAESPSAQEQGNSSESSDASVGSLDRVITDIPRAVGGLPVGFPYRVVNRQYLFRQWDGRPLPARNGFHFTLVGV